MRRLLIFIFLVTCLQVYGQKNELKLNDAINIALKNNPEILKNLKKIDDARAKYTYGISLPQPNLSLSYEYAPDGKGIKDYGERTLEINQSLEFPTRYFTKGSRLNKDIEISEANYELSKIRLTGRIKSAYYKVVYKKLDINIAEENLKISEDFFTKSEIRYNVGEGTNLELLTAKVQRTEAKNTIETAKSELYAAVNELQLEMGLTDKGDFNYVIQDSLSYIKYDLSIEKLLARAYEYNPQIRIADLNINTSSIDKSLAWQNLLPNLNFSYYRQAIPGNANFFGLSFGISVPLWFMFEHRGKIQEANVSYNIAEAEKKSVKNNIISEVKNAYQEFLNKERELLLYRTDILSQAEEIYRTANVSYAQGEANYLLLLEAKKTLISARENYLNAIFQYKLAFVKLEQSIGIILDK